jgi:hypothetical protein
MRRRGLEQRSSTRLAAELVAALLAVMVGSTLVVGAIVAFVRSPLPRSHARPAAMVPADGVDRLRIDACRTEPPAALSFP